MSARPTKVESRDERSPRTRERASHAFIHPVLPLVSCTIIFDASLARLLSFSRARRLLAAGVPELEPHSRARPSIDGPARSNAMKSIARARVVFPVALRGIDVTRARAMTTAAASTSRALVSRPPRWVLARASDEWSSEASGGGDANASKRGRRSTANGNGNGNGKIKSKKSAIEAALQNIFDDSDPDAEEQERERWMRLLGSMWRAFLVLFIAPFVIAQSVKSILVTPWLGAHWGKLNSSLGMQQRQNVADGIQKFEQRLYYDRIISGAGRLHADVERELLVEEARRLEAIEKRAAFQATGNAIGSMIFIVMTVTIITLQKANISRLLGEISDEFIGLDAATQAFILMLVADMVVGYHSSDGWQALLAVIITHYGLDFHKFEMAVRIFVAVVPVTLDIGFKYWVFNKLRKISPSTQIILGEIERH